MSRKNVKQEEIREALMDDSFLDALVTRIEKRLIKGLEQNISEIIRTSMDQLKQELIVKEIKPLQDRVLSLEKENHLLHVRMEIFENQSRQCDVIISGIPESTNAKAASSSDDSQNSTNTTPRMDTTPTVVKCCREVLDIDISPHEVVNSFRIGTTNKNKHRPIMVSFANKSIKDKIMRARKTLRNKKSEIYVNENLTKTNMEIFAKARHLKKEKKIHSCWTYNGHVFIKPKENERPTKICYLEELRHI